MNAEAQCECGWRKEYRNGIVASLALRGHMEKLHRAYCSECSRPLHFVTGTHEGFCINCKPMGMLFETGPLDCAYCGMHFPDFGPLAEHVRTECGPDRSWKKKGNDMSLPKPGTGRGKGAARPQFLKAEHVKSPTIATINRVILEATEFSDVQVSVSFPDKSQFVLGLRLNSPNYRTLFQAFGEDETKWKGKKFQVSSVYSESLEQEVLRVSVDSK